MKSSSDILSDAAAKRDAEMEPGQVTPFPSISCGPIRIRGGGGPYHFYCHLTIHCKIILLDEIGIFTDGLFMTKTTLSSKGQVVLPRIVRSRLHLAPGTRFFCEVQGDSVVLTPEHPVRHEREYVINPLTGLRVTKAAGNAEPVTSEMIKALLEDYP